MYSGIWKTMSPERLQEIVNQSETYKDIITALGLSGNGNYQTIKRYLILWNLKYDHIINNSKKWFVHRSSNPMSAAEIFILNGPSPSTVRRHIEKHNILPYKCAECSNNGMHNGKKLRLQVDHINGNNRDHRLNNLRLLCPNCHSQTSTFCRSAKKVKTSNLHKSIKDRPINPLC